MTFSIRLAGFRSKTRDAGAGEDARVFVIRIVVGVAAII
jgi:hypothetical protein